MELKITLTDIKRTIGEAREKFIKVEEIRIDPDTEASLLSMIGPPTMPGAMKRLGYLMGIPVVVDPMCPPGTMYLGPKLEVETEIEVEE